MGSHKAELIQLGLRIVTEEPIPAMKLPGDGFSLRWYNTLRFVPGLCIRATFHGTTVVSEDTLQKLDLVLVRPEGSLSLTVPKRGAEEPFDNDYAELFVDGFRQYQRQRHPLVPIGLEGLENMPSPATREAIDLLTATELLVA